jgi:hypothetical protein
MHETKQGGNVTQQRWKTLPWFIFLNCQDYLLQQHLHCRYRTKLMQSIYTRKHCKQARFEEIRGDSLLKLLSNSRDLRHNKRSKTWTYLCFKNLTSRSSLFTLHSTFAPKLGMVQDSSIIVKMFRQGTRSWDFFEKLVSTNKKKWRTKTKTLRAKNWKNVIKCQQRNFQRMAWGYL